MLSTYVLSLLALFISIYAQSCPSYSNAKVLTKAALYGSGLQSTVDIFRKILGNPDNGNQPQCQKIGRREINWDGDIVPFFMPRNFFNIPPLTRGFIFSARFGNQFAVSNPVLFPPLNDFRFSTCVGVAQSKQFQTFSDPRLFTSLNDNRFTVTFRCPGTGIKATTGGFGAIFTDVDIYGETYMDFFDEKGCRIKRVIVPVSNKGLSFAGLWVPNSWKNGLDPVIYSVKIKLGTAVIKCPGGGKYLSEGKHIDFVVMDDLFLAEPKAKLGKGGGGGGKGGRGGRGGGGGY